MAIYLGESGMKSVTCSEKRSRSISLFTFSLAVTASLGLSGCMSTMPTMGGSSGNTVTGGAAGGTSAGANSQLESCDETLGTLAVVEDKTAPWWGHYYRRYPKLGSTVPVLRMMIQQSNCFVVVERGRAMHNMKQERALMESGEFREGSNFGKGQMVAADYTMNPSVQFSQKGTGGMGAAVGSFFRGAVGRLAGGVKSNEAATTLLLIDNRSGVQVSAAVGNAKNLDFILDAQNATVVTTDEFGFYNATDIIIL